MSRRKAPAQHRRPWTDADLAWAKEHLGTPGFSLAVVAEQLGRTPRGVARAMERAGRPAPIRSRVAGAVTRQQVAALLGVRSRTVRQWMEAGLLPYALVPWQGRRRAYVVYPGDLVEFLQRHPARYAYDRIPRTWRGRPNPYRPYARPADPTEGYLSLKEAAALLGVSHHALQLRVGKGRFPAVRLAGPGINGITWWVRREDVERLRGGREVAG